MIKIIKSYLTPYFEGVEFNKLELTGYIGSFLYISAYFLTSQGICEGDSFTPNFLNLIGAALYFIYSVVKKLGPVLILEIFWAAVAIMALMALI